MGKLRGLGVALALVVAGCGGEDSPFTRVDTKVPAAASGFLIWSDIWAAAPNDVWAIGNGTVYHHDGATWTAQTITGAQSLQSIWGASPTAIWAVGGDDIAFWNGTTWTASKAPSTGGGLADVHGSSATDVWAVGDNGASVHWDGANWIRRGIAGSFSSSVFAAGTGAKQAWVCGVTDFKEWSGTAWVDIRDQTDHYNCEGLFGFSPTDVWAVGEDEWMLHWDGSAWTRISIGDGFDDFVRAWGAAPDDVWAVGQRGAIKHWNGKSWSDVASGTEQPLVAVHGSSAGDVWIGGNKVMLHLTK